MKILLVYVKFWQHFGNTIAKVVDLTVAKCKEEEEEVILNRSKKYNLKMKGLKFTSL